MASKLCPFCMQMAESEICSHCGKNVHYDGQPMHLPAGCVLDGTHPYVLGAALGQGGFGITYIALDMVTGVRVAIKEYYPTYCASRINNSTVTAYANQEEVYLKGMRSFLEEARTLKSLSDLKNIVNVLDFFEANNTAYLVMEFLEGSSLKDYAMRNGVFSPQKFLEQICPLMEDLEQMHQRGMIHRDIAPDNIILQPDGQMKLIDFGSARSYVGDKSMAMVVKKGFAPVEQYLSNGTTASTDVYALAATIYYCITGTVPMEAPERQYENVPLPSLVSFGADVTPGQEKAIAKALEIQQKDRTQSMQAFLDDLNRERPAPKPEPEKAAPEKPAKKETAPKRNRKSAEKSDVKSVQKTKDHQEKQKPAPKPSEPKPKKQTSGKTAQGSKKTAGAIAAAVLVILSVFGFFLVNRNPGEEPQKLEAMTETTGIPTAETTVSAEPAWKENVLMADYTWNAANAKFWEGRSSASDEELIEYFSVRPVFNTGIPRNKITEVFFLDTVSSAPEKVYDVSADQNGTVLAWTGENEKGALDLYIAGEGGVNGANACYVLFSYYTELESIHFNDCFFTDDADNMSGMFAYCINLKSLDLHNFNTSKVTDTSNMFLALKSITSLDLSSFDTSNVTNMVSMFSCCTNLTSPDLSNFNTSNVTKYDYFMDAGKKIDGLTWEEWFQKSKTPKDRNAEKPVSGEMGWEKNVLMADKTLDADIARFRKEKPGAYESEMYDFYGQRPVFNTDIPRGKVSSVTFLDSLATAPETVYDVSANQDGSVLAWVVKNNNGNFDLHIAGEGGVNGVEACHSLFYGYKALQTVNFNNSFFTDTTQNMSNMFTYCKKLKTVDVSSLNTSAATNMSSMFSNCEALSSLDLSTFDTSNVSSMSFMFAYSPKLKVLDISSFNTSNITDMSYMFAHMTSMVSFDLSHFDTSNVTNMHGMFYGCSNDKFKSLDVSSFDTSNVTDMGYMFANCPFITALDLRNFDTSKVINMSSMFYYCRRLTSLDLSSFDTSNVTNMHAMFDTCSLLPALEISHFNTKRVTDMGYMFNKCGYLRTVDVTQFEVPLLRVTTDMFNGCDKLPVEYKQIGGKYIWYW